MMFERTRMMLGRCMACVGWFFLFAGMACAQDSPADPADSETYFIRSWGINSGLPQLSVNTILQTRDGYLWVGTQNGLSRFDGMRFVNFGIRDGLKSILVRCLLEDRAGALWIGTTAGGLSRMQNGIFTNFSSADGLNNDTILSLALDAEGNIWVGTRNGLNWWDGTKFHNASSLDPRLGENLMCLASDLQGRIWVSLRSGVLLVGDRHGFNDSDIPEKTWPCHAIFEDHAGRIWASHGNGWISCRENGKWIRYDTSSGVPFDRVVCMAEDAGGRLWSGSLGQGITFFEKGRFIPITAGNGLPDNNINALYFDREGNLWAGSRTTGLLRIRKNILKIYGAESGVVPDFVQSVTETRDGLLWIATHGGGVFHTSTNGTFSRYLGRTPEESDDIVGYTYTQAVLEMKNGDIWYSGSQFLICSSSGHPKRYIYPQLAWLQGGDVVSLAERADGSLWAAVQNRGLVRFQNGSWEVCTNILGSTYPSTLLSGTDGSLWVGTLDAGLKRIHHSKTTTIDKRQGLASDSILSIALDPDESIWIGTHGGGLSRWHNGKIDTFTQSSGLPDNTISQLIEDNGWLWIGCNQGIGRISKQELYEVAAGRRHSINPLVLGRAEGMAVEECTHGGFPNALKTRDGLLCFSTVKGLAVVNPTNLIINRTPPPVLIEEIVVDGKIIANENLPLENKLSKKPLSISEDSIQIEFHFTALSYSAPEKVRFRYKLEGLDVTWVEAGNYRTAKYSQLPPGKYAFKVIAANNNGIWNEVGASVSLVVLPHFWQTNWFIAMTMLIFASGIGGTVWVIARRRAHAKIVILERLNALERERSRIARDIHDDLGAQVTKISMIAQSAELETAPNSALRSYVSEINNTSQELIKAMDETVWAVNPKNDTLVHLAHYIFHTAEEFLRHTNIHRQMKMSENLPPLPLSAEVRHNVLLASKEALHNSLKHASATQVRIEITYEKSVFRVSVADNGLGLSSNTGNITGNGLSNMKSRMEQCGGLCTIQSASGSGTTVTLTLKLDETPDS